MWQLPTGPPLYLAAAIAIAVFGAIAIILRRLIRRKVAVRADQVCGEPERPSLPRRVGWVVAYLGSPVMTSLLSIGIIFGLFVLIPRIGASRAPGNQRGYEPAQPIHFSHRLHAGELRVSCLYCHSGAEKSRHAGTPSASTCMNCHSFVTAPLGAIRAEDELARKENRQARRIVSPELQKLYDALALNKELKRDPHKRPQPIAWNKVHNLPDFVYFDHRPHVNAGVACQTCHGPVENMERIRQVGDLSMGWCVNCHRDLNKKGLFAETGLKRVNASIDCATCHY